MLVGRRHREGEVEIWEEEGMIAVEEVAGLGSTAQVEGLTLNSTGALSLLQGRKAEAVVVVGADTRALRRLVKEMFQASSRQQMEIPGQRHGCWG